MASAVNPKTWLVGGGIASLSAAVFLIRDGHILGRDITVIEQLGSSGGSLDGSGDADHGYVLRGGRMLESKYLCTFDLFDSIPTLDGSKTVTREIMDWNETLKTSSQSRLVRSGVRMTAPLCGLTEQHILTIERLALEPEGMLGRTSIEEQFDHDFFKTNFWFMWCTTFAFQPWHSAVEFKRYLVRFVHMVDGFECLKGIMRTVYNQFDSLVRPLLKWLTERGVNFMLETKVTEIGLADQDGLTVPSHIAFERKGQLGVIEVGPDDRVLVTLGSMTDTSSLGGMDTVPGKGTGSAWALWRKLAAGRPSFGNPSAFADHIDEASWLSFTATLHDPAFLRAVRDLTGNAPGEGGLVTFPDSKWLASIVVPFQPHFIGQPKDVAVVWGYGLCMQEPGNFIAKTMDACTGREIMTEIMGHLGIQAEANRILASSVCIPCMMPYITSQFLRRQVGDRPEIVPEDTLRLAFMGQFVEQPDDVVFTVEYSIRSAQTAVYALLGLNLRPPAVYQGRFDPRVLYKAYRALHDIRA